MQLCTNCKIFRKLEKLFYFAIETFHERVIWFKHCIFDFNLYEFAIAEGLIHQI